MNKMRSRFWFAHLSDLHFGNERDGRVSQRQQVLGALIEDLGRLLITLPNGENGPHRLDLLLLTGDIGFAGRDSDYRQAADWLHGLRQGLKVKIQHVAVVPGNHDVDRAAVNNSPESRILHCQLRGETLPEGMSVPTGTARALDQVLQSEEHSAHLLEKFSAYRRFVSEVERLPEPTSEEPGLRSLLEKDVVLGMEAELQVRLRTLNTALLAYNEFDLQKLRTAPLSSYNRAYQRDQWTGPLLLASHHPPTWLHPTAREDIKTFVRQTRAVWCCGHVHEPSADVVDGVGGTGHILQAGASFDVHTMRQREERAANLNYSLCYFERDDDTEGAYRLVFYPRIYSYKQRAFRADVDQLDADQWKRGLDIPPASSAASPSRRTSPLLPLPPTGEADAASPYHVPDNAPDQLHSEPVEELQKRNSMRAIERLNRGAPFARWDDAGRRWTERLDAAGADLCGLPLADRNLSGAYLPYAKLNRADLANARLNGAVLTHAKMVDCDVRGGHMGRAKLSHATLDRARFLGTDLQDASLREASLSGAILRGARLHRTDFWRADLTGLRAEACAGRYTMFDQVQAQRASFARAVLPGARFRGAKLSRANFKMADLRGADLRGADLRDVDFRFADLEGAVLLGADLSGARFARAVLHQALMDSFPADASGAPTDLQNPALPVWITAEDPALLARTEQAVRDCAALFAVTLAAREAAELFVRVEERGKNEHWVQVFDRKQKMILDDSVRDGQELGVALLAVARCAFVLRDVLPD